MLSRLTDVQLATEFILWFEFYEKSGKVWGPIEVKELSSTSLGTFPKVCFICGIFIEVTKEGSKVQLVWKTLD